MCQRANEFKLISRTNFDTAVIFAYRFFCQYTQYGPVIELQWEEKGGKTRMELDCIVVARSARGLIALSTNDYVSYEIWPDGQLLERT